MAAGDAQRAARLVAGGRAAELARGPAPGHDGSGGSRGRTRSSATSARRPPPSGSPRELVWALMREESGYRPDALSVTGARGLLQLMPDTAARWRASSAGSSRTSTISFGPR